MIDGDHKFKNKHRIASARLREFDYSTDGYYFVTICSKNHRHYFGEIVDGKMQLSEAGKLAGKYWAEIPDHFTFAKPDEFVVMPNHIHGIIIIDYSNCRDADLSRLRMPDKKILSKESEAMNRRLYGMPDKTVSIEKSDAINRVSTECKANCITGGATGERNLMMSDSLAKIIRWYKGRCSFEINKIFKGRDFAWQPRFYDHVIRRDESLLRIREYICNNPANWDKDEYFG
ncbi:MAG: transposase [Patescibacteria group bacterium]